VLSLEALASLIGGVLLAALIAYAVLGGADFGGGVWTLVARGPRAGEQQAAIAAAMGPVWEANHVWLIFVIVLIFTAYPAAFAVLSVALFWPFHLVLAASCCAAPRSSSEPTGTRRPGRRSAGGQCSEPPVRSRRSSSVCVSGP
jgi:cytochrome d ubiquinol oxidase subunit II